MFKGTLTAIATPFTADASAVDYDSFKNLVEFQLAAKVDGFVVCGSTGEAATLSDAEYRAVITFVRDAVKGRVPVIAGINSSSTQRAVAMAEDLATLKLDGVLLVSPPYNKPTQEGLYRHFMAVKSASKAPIIAYNIPGRAAVNMLPSTVVRLAKEKAIVGIKESTGSLDQALDLVTDLEKEGILSQFALVSGEDSLVAPLMSIGATGVITAVGNVVPDLFVKLTSAALKGDFTSAGQTQRALTEVVRCMFIETNPIPIKYALKSKGIIAHESMRLPLLPAEPKTREKIDQVLSRYSK